MLFFCSWKDRPSYLVDATDKEKAIARAAALGEGAAPLRVDPFLEDTFAAEVVCDDGEDGDEVSVETVECAVQLLELFDDCSAAPGGGRLPTKAEVADVVADVAEDAGVRVVAMPVPVCGARARGDDGAIVTCVRDKGHASDLGNHRAVGGLKWD